MQQKTVPSRTRSSGMEKAVLVLVSFLVIVFSMNSSSIWIDEGLTWTLSASTSLSDMLRSMLKVAGSEKEMPLHLLYEFIWIKIFGASELALRSSNVPFALLYLLFGYKIAASINEKKKSWLYLLFLLYPVFISYMNEARPYIIMLAMATMVTYYSFYAPGYDAGTFRKINICMFIGLASHMLFAASGAIILFGLLYRYREKQVQILPILKENWYFVLPYAGICGYYAYAVLALPNVSIGNASTPVFISVCTSLFYLFGFGGLFLSRIDLRALDFAALSLSKILLTVGFFIVLVGMLAVFIKGWKQIRARAKYYVGTVLLIMTFFVLLGIVMHYAFWERHLIMLAPVVLSVFCECWALDGSLFKNFDKANILMGGGMALFFLISSVRTSQLYYYQHEDYKHALPAQNAAVLAQGNAEVMAYYGYDPAKSVDELKHANTYISINNMDVNEYQVLLEDVRNGVPEDTELVILLAQRSTFDAGRLYRLEEDDYRWPVVIDGQYNGIKVVRLLNSK